MDHCKNKKVSVGIMTPRVSQGTDRIVSFSDGPAGRGQAASAHQSYKGPRPDTRTKGPPRPLPSRPLPSPSAACYAAPHDLSPVSTPER